MKKSTSSPRKQRNREATIESILTVARTIMRADGVAALSMHELARRMDMRAPSLYNYFSGKLEIYDALFQLGFTLWKEKLANTTQASKSFQEEVQNMMQAYLNFAIENPELFQLCFERPVPGFVPSQASLNLSFGILHESQQRIKQYKQQLNTNLSSEQIINLIIAIAHGITASHLANEPHLPQGKGRFGSLIPVAMSMLEANLIKKGKK